MEDLNKHQAYFITYFVSLATRKHYQITYDAEEFKNEKEDSSKDCTRLHDIIDAPDIDDEEFNLLLKAQKKSEATEIEKLLLEKHFYNQKLGVDLLDESLLLKPAIL